MNAYQITYVTQTGQDVRVLASDLTNAKRIMAMAAKARTEGKLSKLVMSKQSLAEYCDVCKTHVSVCSC